MSQKGNLPFFQSSAITLCFSVVMTVRRNKKIANQRHGQLENSKKSVRIPKFSSPYSVQMRENIDQKNSEYGYFLGSEVVKVLQ